MFPYCDLWVVVHSDGTVNVFDEYVTTNAEGNTTIQNSDALSGNRIVRLHVDGESYTFHDEEIDELHALVRQTDECEEAWEAIRRHA